MDGEEVAGKCGEKGDAWRRSTVGQDGSHGHPRSNEISKGQRPGAGAKTTPAPPSKPPMQSLPPASQHHRERVERGWPVFDAWCGDIHLCEMIGSMALYYRDEMPGYPSGMGRAEWDSVLTRIGEPLLRYARNKFKVYYCSKQPCKCPNVQHDRELTAAASEALRLFAVHFKDFWA